MTLAFDTSSTSGSIALVRDGSLVAEWTVGDVGTHADWLMRSIDGILASRGLRVTDVDNFAVCTGPGSFTGLRIGVSTVKGLAWALGKDVITVSTLKALALNARYSLDPVCPMLDARKKEVYTALYSFSSGSVETLIPESALPPSELFDKIRDLGLNAPVLFIGSGLAVYGQLVREQVRQSVFAPEPLWHVRAANTALLASEPDARSCSPLTLAPVYLRKSEAEIKAGRTGR